MPLKHHCHSLLAQARTRASGMTPDEYTRHSRGLARQHLESAGPHYSQDSTTSRLEGKARSRASRNKSECIGGTASPIEINAHWCGDSKSSCMSSGTSSVTCHPYTRIRKKEPEAFLITTAGATQTGGKLPRGAVGCSQHPRCARGKMRFTLASLARPTAHFCTRPAESIISPVPFSSDRDPFLIPGRHLLLIQHGCS